MADARQVARQAAEREAVRRAGRSTAAPEQRIPTLERETMAIAQERTRFEQLHAETQRLIRAWVEARAQIHSADTPSEWDVARTALRDAEQALIDLVAP